MQALLEDVRQAARQLRRSPGFAAAVIVTFALGIGANAAVFSVMNAVLLRMLPVHDPSRLFYLTHVTGPENISSTGDYSQSFGINVYRRLREDKSVFSDVIGYVPMSFTKTAVRYGQDAEELVANEVSGNFFSALGAPMAAGQPFNTGDEDRHAPVAVLSYGYWTRRFHRDPGVLGRTVYVNGVPFTVTGVAGPHFIGVEPGGIATDLWVPLQTRPELNAWGVPAQMHTLYGDPNWWGLMLMARLRPGVTPATALARTEPLFTHAAYETLGAEGKQGPQKLGLQIVPARGLGTAAETYRQPLHVLMGMVSLVLVIACVNIAMLLLARNAGRQHAFSLRLALGASRWPLFRQLLAESGLLVVLGVALGMLFAMYATRLLAAWSDLDVSLAPDLHVLVFTVALASLAALVFGLAPLRAAVNAPVITALRSSGRQASSGRREVLAGNLLVGAQLALCIALLAGAGLLIRTLRNYEHVDLGMQAGRVLAFGVNPIGATSDAAKVPFYDRLTDRLRTVPGVSSVALAEFRPGSGWSDNNGVTVDGYSYPWKNGQNALQSNDVSPGFFQTLGIPVLAGRGIEASDTNTSAPVVVVNQTFADRYLHGRSGLGHQIGTKRRFTIVGVVKDSKFTSADEEPVPMAWYSYAQSPSVGAMDVELRTAGDPLTLLPTIRRMVREMDADAPVSNPRVLIEQFRESYAMPALFARLAAFFGGLAALLVAVGLYGTLAYRVSQRTTEIGVRMALGAQHVQLMWMVLRDSLLLVAAGLVVGLPLAWFGSRLMTSMLYGLPAHDLTSFAAAVMSVLGVALAAAWLPARRAASVDPMVALRAE